MPGVMTLARKMADGAVEVAGVHVEQDVELVDRLERDLEAAGEFVVAAEVVVAGGAACCRSSRRGAGRAPRRGPAMPGAIAPPTAPSNVIDAERAVGGLRAGVEFLGRLDRGEAHDAGGGVAAEQRALRAAIDLDAVDVEDRRRL